MRLSCTDSEGCLLLQRTCMRFLLAIWVAMQETGYVNHLLSSPRFVWISKIAGIIPDLGHHHPINPHRVSWSTSGICLPTYRTATIFASIDWLFSENLGKPHAQRSNQIMSLLAGQETIQLILQSSFHVWFWPTTPLLTTWTCKDKFVTVMPPDGTDLKAEQFLSHYYHNCDGDWTALAAEQNPWPKSCRPPASSVAVWLTTQAL